MSKKVWLIAAGAVSAVVAGISVWTAAVSQSGQDEPPDTPTDAPASHDGSEWDEDRMRNATPAPMPTVD
ncbi:hypothetical protein [Glycomyces xiaoerkulensis]|uniref:hypothetical protein n=1 Tax=Glycomyces xiaoerkulensis TaxID=2038139 RepID=UPI000C26760E|nr:hypothetical protein [Glycomyces xiaoerkulensis]